jgi:tRNA G18 (ribose-2'-O)-methylase SpoU
VSSGVLAKADQRVELPTMGMANSLNVSMSAGMLVLAAYQQLIK